MWTRSAAVDRDGLEERVDVGIFALRLLDLLPSTKAMVDVQENLAYLPEHPAEETNHEIPLSRVRPCLD
jgi:hypothetical protein